MFKKLLEKFRLRVRPNGGAEKLARFFIYLTLFLAPLMTITLNQASLEYDKVVFFWIMTAIIFFCWMLKTYQDKRLEVKWDALDLGLGIFLAVYLAAIFFGRDAWRSFLGTDANLTYTWINLAILALFYRLAKVFLVESKQQARAMIYLMISGWLAVAYTLLALFQAKVFSALVSSSILSLNIFIAAVAIVSCLLYRQSKISGSKAGKIFSVISFIVFNLFLWYQGQALAMLLLVIFAAASAIIMGAKMKLISSQQLGMTAAYLLVITFMMVIPVFQLLHISPANFYKTPTVEMNLPFAAQLPIAGGILKNSFLLGFGPANFNLAFHAFKPAIINVTPFYGQDFSSAQTLALEILVGGGVLGLIAFYGALLNFLRLAWKKKTPDSVLTLIALSTLIFYSLIVNYELASLLVIFSLLAMASSKMEHRQKIITLNPSQARAGLLGGLILLSIFGYGILRPKLSAYYFLFQPLTTDGKTVNLDNLIGGAKFALAAAPYVSAGYSNLAEAQMEQYSQSTDNKDFDKIGTAAEIRKNIQSALNLAKQYYEFDAVRIAMRDYQQAVEPVDLGLSAVNDRLKELDPTNPDPLVFEAMSNYELLKTAPDLNDPQAKKLEEIIDYDFTKAIKLKDNDTDLYGLAADYYQFVKNDDKAIEYYQKILELAPSDEQTVTKLLDLYLQTKKYQQAIDLADKYLADNPDNVNLLKAKADAVKALKSTK